MTESRLPAANCDTALKDALSFISGQEISHRWGEGLMTSEQDMHNQTDPTPAVQSQAAGGQTAPVTPMNRGEIPMECRRGESTMEPRETSMDRGEIHHGAHENQAAQGDLPWTEERSLWSTEEESSPWSPGEHPLCSQGRGRKATSTAVHHHTIWIGQPESRQWAV